MLLGITIASLILTAILVIVGLLISPNETDEEASGGKDLLHILGFVNETPNLIRAIVAGNEENGPILRYVSNLHGKKIKEDGKVVPLKRKERPFENEDPFQLFLIKNFGRRWIGLPFFRSVKPAFIDRVVIKDTGGTNQEEMNLAGTLHATKKKVYGLYGEFPRPTYHNKIDTMDQVRFNITSTAIIQVEDAVPFFTIYHDEFLQTISEIIGTFISNQVLNMEWEDYKKRGANPEEKSLGTEKFANKMDDLNLRLKPLGVKATHLYISDPEISKAAEEMQKALEATRISKEKANARIAEGEGEKGYAVKKGEGEALVIERIAEAKASRYKQLMTLYASNGIEGIEAVKMANRLIALEFNAEAVGKLTTYVAGGTGVQLSIPTEEGR